MRECVVKVSTIFLELNHGFGDEDLWYETMIFSDKPEIECYFCERYKTKQEAIKKMIQFFKVKVVPVNVVAVNELMVAMLLDASNTNAFDAAAVPAVTPLT